METVATLAVGLVIDMAGAFKELDTGLGKLANKAATGGKMVAAGIGLGTAALVTFGTKSVKIATDFESQMAIMSTAVDPLGPSLEELDAIILKIGADNELLGITATEAAEGVTNFFKAGLDANEVLGDYDSYMTEGTSLTGAFRAAVDLAAASDLDLAASSELVAVSMGQYNLSAEDSIRITDIFVKVADASQAEVSDLAVAMSYVGPTAHAMRIPIEDTAVALGLLSEGGIKGSSAGTTLNRVLSDLNKTTPKSQKAMATLGIEVYDVHGKMKPLPELMAHLNEKLGENATITQVVGGVTEELTKAYEKANAKAGPLATKISEQEQQLVILNRELDATVEKYGASSTQADKKRLAITKLTNRLNENKAELSGHLGVVDEYHVALEGATTVTRELTDQERAEYQAAIFTTQARRGLNVLLSENNEKWDTMTQKVGEAATAEEVGAARTNTFAGTMEKLGGTVETLQIMAGKALLPVLGTLADLFNEFTGNYTPQITAAFEWFAGVIASTVEAAKMFFGELNRGEGIASAVQNALFFLIPEDTAQKIGEIIGEISEFVTGLIELVSGFVEWKDVLMGTSAVLAAVIIPLLWSVLSPLLALGAAVVAAIAIVAALRNAWETDFSGIRTFVGGILDWLRSTWDLIVEKFKEVGIVDALISLRDAFGELWAAVQPILEDLWELIGDLWDTIKEAFGGSGEDTLEFAEIVEFAAELVVGQIEFMAKGIKVLVTVMKFVAAYMAWRIERMAKHIKKFARLMNKLWKAHGKNIMGIIKNTFKIILKIVTTAIKVIVKIIKMWMKIFNGDWEEAWEIAKDILSDIWDAMIKIVELAADNIKKFIDSWLKILLGLMKKGWEAIQAVIEDVWEDIQDFIEDITEAIKRGIDAWLKVLESLIRAGWEAIQDLTEDIWNAIESFIESVTDAIEKTIDTWLDALESLIRSGWQAIQDLTESAWNAIESFIDTVTSSIQSLLDSWINTLKSLLQSGWDAIKNAVESAWNAIKGVIESVTSSIRGILESWISTIQNTLQSGWDAIRNAIESAWNTIESIISGAIDSIRTTIDSWLDTIKTIWTNAWNSLADIVSTAWDTVKTVVSDGISGLADIVVTVSGTLVDMGKNIISYIKSGIVIAWSTIVTEIKKIKDKVADAITAVASSLISTGGEIIDYILDGIKAGIGAIYDYIWEWIRSQFGASEPTDPTSVFRSSRLRKIGGRIGREIAMGVVGERTNIARAIQSELGAAMPGISGLGGAAFAGAAGGTYQAGPFYTTITTEIEENEFLFRVEQAVRTLQQRGE